MAKIKRIVVSETEGRNLSDRYADNSYVYDVDGRINYYGHSKMQPVIEPGVVYGSNGDSGDGVGLNTIKLIPQYQGDDRYIIIDPTAPNHIHIRAGGQQDASNAELILGAEKANVRVADYNHSVGISTYNAGDDIQNSWSFDNSGNLLASQDAVIGVNTVPGHLTLSAYTGTTFAYSDTDPDYGVFLKDKTNPANRVATIGDIQGVAFSPEPTSWTPLLVATGFAQSSNPATGSFMHFGKLAVVNLTIPFSAVTNFGTGQYSVNLPVAAAKHTDLWAGTLHNTSSSDYYSIKGHVDAESSTMTLWAIASTLKDEPFKFNYPIVLDTTDLFHMSFIYETV